MNFPDPAFQRAYAHRARREYLDAVDTGRRTLRLRLSSPVLLRKPQNNRQAKLMRQLAEELTEQVRDQMRRRGKRRFRSPVAVNIALHAVALGQAPGTPPSVKAYLDVLQGLVYLDDRDVHLLHATRHATDNPILRDHEHGWVWDAELPRFPVGPEQDVEVVIDVTPVRLYTACYDAMWHRRDEVFDDLALGDHDVDGKEFFEARYMDDLAADDQLDDLEIEQREDLERTGLLYGPGGLYDQDEAGRLLRSRLRSMREQQIASLRNRFLLSQRLGPLDRPGRCDASYLAASGRSNWPWARGLVLPGFLELPLPSQTMRPSSYARSVSGLLEDHAQHFRSRAPFATPLALDIAVRQPRPGRKDLDNLAHALMVPYEQVFCGGQRGTIASYRVYVSDSGPPGVRVLVMPDARLDALPRALESTRHWILAQRPHL